MSGLEDCGNCGRRIGKLETANVWKEHVVCIECWQSLTSATGKAAAQNSGARTVAPARAMARSAAPRTGQPGYDVSSDAPTTIASGYLLKCTRCGGSYLLSEVSDVGGRIVCRECSLAQAARAVNMAPLRSAAQNPWLLTVGASVVVLALLVGAFVYFFDRASARPRADNSSRPEPAPAARNVDQDMGGQLVKLMLDGAGLEAAGKPEEAQKQYHAVMTMVAMRRQPTPEQQQIAARAQAAMLRIQSGLAAAAKKPASIFDDNSTASAATAAAGVESPGPPAQPARPVKRPGITTTAAPSLADALAAASEAGGAGASPTEKGKTQKTPDEPAEPFADAEPGAPGAKPDRPRRNGTKSPTIPPTSEEDGMAARGGKGKPRDPRAPSGFGVEIDRGRDALAAGQFPAALDLFKLAMSADKKSPHAHHGLGLAYYGLGQQAKAIESLEKAEGYGPNRAIVHNLAVVHMKDNPMRAAKFVKEFLSLPDTPLDEPLQNVLGLAMVTAPGGARTGATYAELRKFYFEYDHRLAVARNDGNKRWGMRWIRAEDADVRWARSKKAAEDLANASRDAGRAALRTKKAYQAVRDIATSFRLRREREIRAARARYEDAVEDEQSVKKRLATARSAAGSTEQPQFPTYLRVIPIDALDPSRHPQ